MILRFSRRAPGICFKHVWQIVLEHVRSSQTLTKEVNPQAQMGRRPELGSPANKRNKGTQLGLDITLFSCIKCFKSLMNSWRWTHIFYFLLFNFLSGGGDSSILSNLHSADLQKRQPNVAPHLDESFIHHFCFFFLLHLIGHLQDGGGGVDSDFAAPLIPIRSCQQNSEHVMKV